MFLTLISFLFFSHGSELHLEEMGRARLGNHCLANGPCVMQTGLTLARMRTACKAGVLGGETGVVLFLSSSFSLGSLLSCGCSDWLGLVTQVPVIFSSPFKELPVFLIYFRVISFSS